MQELFSLWNLPLYSLIIGQIVFTAEVVWDTQTDGKTSLLAIFLFICTLISMLLFRKKDLKLYFDSITIEFKWIRPHTLLLITLFLLSLVFFQGLREGIHPPHLLDREYDTINYHMTLPKQHLLFHSLSWIPWSTADFFPMSLQWGLSPYWFATPYPNKFPQLFFTFALAAALLQFGRIIQRSENLPLQWSWIPLIAFFASHGVLIQLGTSMLDLTTTACLLLGILQFRKTYYVSSALYLSFWAASKSFYIFLLAGTLVGILLIATFLDRKHPIHIFTTIIKAHKKFAFVFSLSWLYWMGPSLVQNIYLIGTPIFPFGVCQWPGVLCKSTIAPSLRLIVENYLRVRDQYGIGRDFFAFLKSLWSLAVPEKGVVNAYDYPLGLPWLLWIPFIPFALHRAFYSVKNLRSFPWELLIALGLWAGWWMGSQQARWLYPTIALGWIGILPTLAQKTRFQTCCLALCVGLIFGTISMQNAFQFAHHQPFQQTLHTFSDIGKEMTEQIEQTRPMSGQPWLKKELLYLNEPVQSVQPDTLLILPRSPSI